METIVGQGETTPVNPIGPLLVLEIGKIQGVQSTMLTTINNIQQQITKLNDENERKHEILGSQMVLAKETMVNVVNSHSKEDDVRFGKVNRIIWAAGGIFGAINFVLLIANLYSNWIR